MREYMLARYHRRRQDWIDSQGGKCVKCGSVDRLEIDHINKEEKLYSVAKILTSGNEELVAAELAKCQVLCYDCHRDKTREENGVPHGGGVSGKKNCKCAPCKAKKNEYLRAYKKARRASS